MTSLPELIGFCNFNLVPFDLEFETIEIDCPTAFDKLFEFEEIIAAKFCSGNFLPSTIQL